MESNTGKRRAYVRVALRSGKYPTLDTSRPLLSCSVVQTRNLLFLALYFRLCYYTLIIRIRENLLQIVVSIDRKGILMPTWDEILNEVQDIRALDVVREKYLDELANTTGRNIICYYSAFLTKQGEGMSIADSDMTGFMTVVKGMEKSKGLDLILHTPGGSPTAAEAIVKYLRALFGIDIRAIVPQIAMSAGTMIACAGKEILMGKHSSLGPVDPQISGYPAFNIKKVFEDAKDDLSKNQNIPYWQIQLSKYPPQLIYDCINAIDLSSDLVSDWLKSGMFIGDPDAEQKVKSITEGLNQNKESKNHGRHFDKEKCKEFLLKVEDLEDDDSLQDAVLSLHHAYMVLLDNSPVVKIIESQLKGKRYVISQKNISVTP